MKNNHPDHNLNKNNEFFSFLKDSSEKSKHIDDSSILSSSIFSPFIKTPTNRQKFFSSSVEKKYKSVFFVNNKEKKNEVNPEKSITEKKEKSKIHKNSNYNKFSFKKKNLKKLTIFDKKINFNFSFIKYLKLIFLNKEVEIDFTKLNYEEKIFLFFLLHRKMNKTPNPKIKNFDFKENHYLIEKVDFFKNIFQSKKRFEENFKAFFKAFINYKKKNLDEFQIYKYYFLEISKEKKIEFENYLDPTLKKTKKQKFKNLLNQKKTNNSENFLKIKCFNQKYLKLIITSPSFKNDFLDFITNKIEILYIKSQDIEKKISKIVNNIIEKKIGNLNVKEIIYNFLIKNQHCKLPWTISEVNYAKDSLISLINNFS